MFLLFLKESGLGLDTLEEGAMTAMQIKQALQCHVASEEEDNQRIPRRDGWKDVDSRMH